FCGAYPLFRASKRPPSAAVAAWRFYLRGIYSLLPSRVGPRTPDERQPPRLPRSARATFARWKSRSPPEETSPTPTTIRASRLPLWTKLSHTNTGPATLRLANALGLASPAKGTRNPLPPG